MGNFVSLLVQATAVGALACAPLYFGLPKPRNGLYPKLIAVFVASQVFWSLVMPTTGDSAKDWFQMLIGPMILAYVAGRFIFTKPAPTL